MKKNNVLPVLIVLAIIFCTIFMSDGLTYLVTSMMVLAIIGTIQHKRSWVMKLTRWGKANPGKAQVLISVLQIVLMTLGIISGYNIKKLGYELSDITAFIFGGVIVIGFLSVHFLPKRSTIALPPNVNRQRLVFMGIAISSFIMMVVFGNRIDNKYPNSALTHAIKAIDHTIFWDNGNLNADPYDFSMAPVNSEIYDRALIVEPAAMAVFASFSVYDKETINPPVYSKKESRAKLKAEKKAMRLEKKKARMMNRIEKYRLALAAGLSVGAVLLIILLAILTCAGLCLVAGGVSALVSGEALGILAILGGGLISWQAIRGIAKVKKQDKPKTK